MQSGVQKPLDHWILSSGFLGYPVDFPGRWTSDPPRYLCFKVKNAGYSNIILKEIYVGMKYFLKINSVFVML